MNKSSLIKFKYIILLVFLLFFVGISTQLSIYTYEKTLSSYQALPNAIVNYFIYIIFGVILGSESLLLQKKYIKYCFNPARFLLLSVPFFILGSLHLISISGLFPLRLIPLFYNQQFTSFFQIIFGYNLINSFICNKESII